MQTLLCRGSPRGESSPPKGPPRDVSFAAFPGTRELGSRRAGRQVGALGAPVLVSVLLTSKGQGLGVLPVPGPREFPAGVLPSGSPSSR